MTRNLAPEWTPGMKRVAGMAAHPSMQAKTTEQLFRGYERLRQQLLEARRLHPGRERDEYIERLRELRKAFLLALEWREGSE